MSWWSRFFGSATVTPALPNARGVENNLMKQVYPNTMNNEGATDPMPLNINNSMNRRNNANRSNNANRRNNANGRNNAMPSEENVYGKVYPNERNRAYSQSNNFNRAESLPPATLTVTGGSRRGRSRSKRSTKRRRNARRTGSRR